MQIINLVPGVKKVQFGIWNAAVSTTKYLKRQYKVESEMWYPKHTFDNSYEGLKTVELKTTDLRTLQELIIKRKLHPNNSIFVTHSSWNHQTRWGAQVQKKGFRWVYIPHGTLEPWSMSQGKLKKQLYFQFQEGPMTTKADAIVAVGHPEMNNLKQRYKNTRIERIPNGVEIPALPEKKDGKVSYLFLARLHHKKGVLPLVQGWIASQLNNRAGYELTIAGPDQGEIEKINPLLSRTNNVKYIGPQYGKDKTKLLEKSHFYVLPSYSEGFPTSVLEAGSFGLIPLITDGCNFPELFDAKLAVKISPDVDRIKTGLESTIEINELKRSKWQHQLVDFIETNYSLSVIAEKQYQLYSELLGK